MFPLSIKAKIQTLFLVLVLSLVYGQDRKIIPQLNPGCTNCTAENTLIYVKAIGSHDTVHQIWDFTGGIPTTLFAITAVNSSYIISWEGTKPSTFALDKAPTYMFGASLEELFPQQLDLLPFKDFAVELPHLIHTANSTLVDLNFVNLTSSEEFKAPRFAVRLRMASRDPNTDSMRYYMRKSLDDEHTPGVFEVMELKTPESYYNGDGGYIQFRPVAYTQPARGVASSTIVHVSNFVNSSLSWPSTMRVFFDSVSPLLVQDMVISFGETGDGFYTKHNYTGWSYTIGYGSPPVEGFSLFVILIIAIGLSVPVVLALSGVVFVLLRRMTQRNTPARFVDDD
ncbi:glycosylated lysosomal membrane protein-like [Hyposmocoma kahamanoa]|uniref:glycosylated lysosomal membrane protein-like n=1 Tax=Hyposmocoma kahamanoa TaxID=1477025 RepID=UPI000E6D8EBB|nr:glycosylated lysosomal membrane protein-like [Hyposmocoma kahamanoa]